MRLDPKGSFGTSITWRLSIWFSIVALVVFTIFCSAFLWLLSREMHRGIASELQSKLDIVQHYIDETAISGNPAELSHHLDDILIGHGGLRIWILGVHGSVLYGGKTRPQLIGREDRYGLYALLGEDGLSLRGLRRSLKPNEVFPAAELLAGIDIRAQDQLLRYSGNAAILLGLIGVASSAALGHFVSRRSLTPLKKLSTLADQIDASSIRERLPEVGADAEVKALVRSFNMALDRIETGYRQQEAFSADVAHELNTPLATLIAGNETALRSPLDQSHFEQFVGNNLEDLHRLSAIVKDMLFLARAEQGVLARRSEISSLAKLVSDVVEFYEGLLSQSRLTVTVVGDVAGLFDAALLKRAISNLLSNAVRYAHTGSTVLVLLSQASASTAAIFVENSGPVIPAEHLSKVFDRFFRADSARSDAATHHGLGLAIVAGIAKMHGGSASAYSSSRGTRIGFTIATQ